MNNELTITQKAKLLVLLEADTNEVKELLKYYYENEPESKMVAIFESKLTENNRIAEKIKL